MKIKLIICLILFSIISSCATTEGFKKRMQMWEGRSEEELINQLGFPAEEREYNGVHYLTYNFSEEETTPGFGGVVDNGAGGLNYYNIPASTRYIYCNVTFLVRDESIIGWRAEGNSCISR